MKDLKLSGNCFDPRPTWCNTVAKLLYIPTKEDLELFDQNGYDLTVLEQHFAASNDVKASQHRLHRWAIKQDWFTQSYKKSGAILNHSLLFERKSYSGAALDQLKYWAQELPMVYKVVSLRSKWGLDFSMDWVDDKGNAFEVLHWEWDGFDFEEVDSQRQRVETILLSIDWDDAGKSILSHKPEWHHLDFFAQSNWKCDYFGIPKERFKMVAWQ